MNCSHKGKTACTEQQSLPPRAFEPHKTLWDELSCHFPYAILSVAIALIVLSFLPVAEHVRGTDFEFRLFHSFHFLHLLFAGTGTVLTLKKYGARPLVTMVMGFVVPALFCTLSDVLLPYVGGRFVSLHMHFHWCFFSHFDTVLPFLITGMINGWIMGSHRASQLIFYSIGSHFLHIFISSMASILYLISFGFYQWSDYMGFVFLYSIFVTLIPCTLADIVVPMLVARLFKSDGIKHEKHKA